MAQEYGGFSQTGTSGRSSVFTSRSFMRFINPLYSRLSYFVSKPPHSLHAMQALRGHVIAFARCSCSVHAMWALLPPYAWLETLLIEKLHHFPGRANDVQSALLGILHNTFVQTDPCNRSK